LTDPRGRERDPLQSRRRRLRRLFLRTPEEIVGSYLTDDEQVILIDEPSTNAFLVEAANEIFIIVGIALLTGFLMGQGGGVVAGVIGFLVIDVLAIFLVAKRVRVWYTRYVLTDFRVMRCWGVFNRQMAWIPWGKVTDVFLTQTVPGRLFGYATVRIESANEQSGLKEMTDLRDPHKFLQTITEVVELRQTKVVL
jgi:uncharacterized membrane protein YdbT with pleckstrin-like domain